MNPLCSPFVFLLAQSALEPTPPAPRAIVERARAVLLDGLQRGEELHGEVALDVTWGNGRTQHMAGKLWCASDGGGVVLAPTQDPKAPGGEASSATRVGFELHGDDMQWSVSGREAWGLEPTTRAFAAPARLERPLCMPLPPAAWTDLAYTIRSTTLDPHRFIASRVASRAREHAHEREHGDARASGRGDADAPARADAAATDELFWILTSEPKSRLDATRSGQIELWFRASSGLLERVVIAASPTGSSDTKEFVRAIVSFRHVAFSARAGARVDAK